MHPQAAKISVWQISLALTLAFSIFIAPNAFARDLRIASDRTDFCQSLAAGQPVFPPLNFGLGDRGFLGNFVPNTEENRAAARALGILPWRGDFYPVQSLDEISAHINAHKDKMIMDLWTGNTYFLVPPGVDFATLSPEAALAVYQEAVNAGRFYYANVTRDPESLIGAPLDIRVEPMNADHVRLLLNRTELNPNNPMYARGNGLFGPHIRVGGWTYQRQGGVLLMEDTLRGRTYRKIANDLRQFLEQGGSIEFNTNNLARFHQDLEVLRNTKRFTMKDQEVVEADGTRRMVRVEQPQDPELNRFVLEENVQAAIEDFLAGRVFSVSVRDANDRVVGMNLVNYERDRNRFEPDTVGYVDGGINYAKFAAAAMIARLAAAGIFVVDTGMVTGLSGALNARAVTRPRFDELMNTMLPAQPVEIDFSPVGRMDPSARRPGPSDDQTIRPWWEDVIPEALRPQMRANIAPLEANIAARQRAIEEAQNRQQLVRRGENGEPESRYARLKRRIDQAQNAQQIVLGINPFSSPISRTSVDGAVRGATRILEEEIAKGNAEAQIYLDRLRAAHRELIAQITANGG